MHTRPISPDELQDVVNRVGRRKPRLGIMGEFSAGKSTLTNLLIGTDALPVKVTATQLPPVWLSCGSASPYRVDLDGNNHSVVLEELSEIPIHDTQHIRIQCESPFLEACDLIDFPGISDPNMASSVWEQALPLVDGVLWCTHANQAWRQSEAAVWEELYETIGDRSLLLITRMDKVVTQRDRERLLARVAMETEGQFAGTLPLSLTHALAAGDDDAELQSSGAKALYDALQVILPRLDTSDDKPVVAVAPRAPPVAANQEHPKGEPTPPDSSDPDRVVPRRVAVRRLARRQKPVN